MKGKLWRSVLGGTALVLGATSIAAAQGSTLPGNGWYTTAVIQNLSSNQQDNVTLSAYDASSTTSAALSASTSIPGNGSVTFRPDAPGTAGTIGISGLTAGFFGSMVISSLEPLAAVASISNVPLGTSLGVTGGQATANYQGASVGQTTLTFPSTKLRFTGGTTTVFYVQSTGGDGSFSAVVRTSSPDSKVYSGTFQIAANRTTVVPIGTLKLNGTGATWEASAPATGCTGGAATATGSPCFGALTLTSTTPVVGTAVEYQSSVVPNTQVQAAALFTSSQAASQVFCPVYKNRFPGGANTAPSTGITIQNVGSAATTITARIVGNATPGKPTNAGSGDTFTQVFQGVAPGASVVLSRFAGDGSAPASTVGAVTITADNNGSIIAAATETSPVAATTHACFSAANAAARVALPIHKKAFPRVTNSASANTGTVIQNVDTNPANVTVTFTCRAPGASSTTNTTVTVNNVAAGSSFSIFRNNANDRAPSAIPDETLCAAQANATVAGATTGGKIVAIANESSEGLQITQRDSSNYEGFPQ